MNKLIGNTPLIKIKYKYNGKEREIYTKLESYNLTGSIKDRMADYIIRSSINNGTLKDNMPIIEATSGNTGISLSAIGAKYKHPVYIFMPDFVSKERLKLMELYGAHVKMFSKKEGGFQKCIEKAKKLSEELDGFLVNQFSNPLNVEAHYQTTGKEIIERLHDVSAFVSGIGSGGTLMGIGKRLKENLSNCLVVALEPDTMALLTHGIIDSHKIEGIGDDFIPDLIDISLIDNIITINDDDAINMCLKLSKELGLGVGISSGANFLGSIITKENIKGNVVTVFADDNKKYLSTGLTSSDNANFISNRVELIDYEIV